MRWVGQTPHNCEESCKGLSGRIKQRIFGKLRTENQPRNAPNWPYADRSTDTSGARLIFLSKVRMQAPITIKITITRSNNANAAAILTHLARRQHGDNTNYTRMAPVLLAG